VTTLAQITDEVLMGLSSYGLVQPRYAQLTADPGASGTTITLDSVTGFEVGHSAEIGDELVYVTAVSEANLTLTVVRGYLSTTAAAHAVGTLVSCNPLWPRWMVQRAINDAIVGSWPRLFAVDTETLSGTALYNAYTLPATVESVRSVKIEDIAGSRELFTYSEFRYDFNRHELNLHVQAYEGQDLEVEYIKRPVEITASQELILSGLNASARQYVVAQATADLVTRMDTHRLQVNFASAADMAANRPSGSANALARTLLAVAEVELNAERRRLVQQYPPVIVKSKGRF
jgi:hypothetical protein